MRKLSLFNSFKRKKGVIWGEGNRGDRSKEGRRQKSRTLILKATIYRGEDTALEGGVDHQKEDFKECTQTGKGEKRTKRPDREEGAMLEGGSYPNLRGRSIRRSKVLERGRTRLRKFSLRIRVWGKVWSDAGERLPLRKPANGQNAWCADQRTFWGELNSEEGPPAPV